MERNSTPTNEMITEAASMYVMILTMLHLPAAVFATHGMNARPFVFVAAPVCDAIETAARFWDNGITTPLTQAHEAMHLLSEVSLIRATTKHDPNSPMAVAFRTEIKRHRLVIAEAEALIRRETEKTSAQIRVSFLEEVVDYLRNN